MKIAEVEKHIGEEFAVGYSSRYTPAYRVRIDGIETVVHPARRGWDGFHPERKERVVKVTYLHPVTGVHQRVDTLRARDIDGVRWAPYWERRQAEAHTRENTSSVAKILARYLEASEISPRVRDIDIRLTTEQASTLIERLTPVGADEEEGE